MTILVGKVFGCALALFRMTCGSAWLRSSHPLLRGDTIILGDCAFPTGRPSPG